MLSPGKLILVVGPSGAGKDSLIATAKSYFANDDKVVFARRCITRASDPYGEAHEPLSVDDFQRREIAGEFMLTWRAHGLRYGVPQTYADDLVAGKSVIANVSRTVIGEARARFQPLSVVHVTASPHVLAQRLAGRRREDLANQKSRLDRSVPDNFDGGDVITIRNDEALAVAADLFVKHLEAFVGPARNLQPTP